MKHQPPVLLDSPRRQTFSPHSARRPALTYLYKDTLQTRKWRPKSISTAPAQAQQHTSQLSQISLSNCLSKSKSRTTSLRTPYPSVRDQNTSSSHKSPAAHDTRATHQPTPPPQTTASYAPALSTSAPHLSHPRAGNTTTQLVRPANSRPHCYARQAVLRRAMIHRRVSGHFWGRGNRRTRGSRFSGKVTRGGKERGSPVHFRR